MHGVVLRCYRVYCICICGRGHCITSGVCHVGIGGMFNFLDDYVP